MGQGPHQHPGSLSRPRPPISGRVIPGGYQVNPRGRRGGQVRHQLRRGGRFQGGGQSVCPAGTERTADGRCTPMGS